MRSLNQRPHSVTAIGCLFMVAGLVGLAYHATQFKTLNPFQYDIALVCLVRLLAILAGIFVLLGRNWARLLLLVWLAYHVILSAFHSASALITHSVLLAVVAYFLFRPPASAYFRPALP